MHLNYEHIKKLCHVGLICNGIPITVILLHSVHYTKLTSLEYLLSWGLTIYCLIIYGVFRTTWIVSFGIISHILKQLKRRCIYMHSKDFQAKVKIDNMNLIRILYHRTCELFRQLNDVYSYQLLPDFSSFFTALTFFCFHFVLHFTCNRAKWVNIIYICSILLGKIAIIYPICNCTA